MADNCVFCELDFEHIPVKKVIRGESMIFCSESCYRLWFYKMPKDNRQGWLPIYMASVKIEKNPLVD